MKKTCALVLMLVFATALTVYTLTSCNRNDGDYEKTTILPESTSDKILTVIGGNKSEDLWQSDEYVEDELPPEEFVGTIIEEENDYIVVLPNTDEEEYEIAEKIRIDFTSYHKDYVYGTGRKVLVTYIPHIEVKDGVGYVTTDSIDTEGFEDFDLFTVPKDKQNAVFVLNNSQLSQYNSDYDLYYYGVRDVYVTVDGKTLPLADALRLGKVTLNGILSKCNTLAARGEIEDEVYKDGGSKIYLFDDFNIVKFHTLDGNRNMFIGSKELNVNSASSSMHMFIGIYDIYGLDITAKDVTDTGLTLVFEKHEGVQTGTLQFGEYYRIEKLTDSVWESVPYSDKVDAEIVAWHEVAYLINDFAPYTEHKIDWSYLYGTLDAGTYRIEKEIIDFRKAADYDTFTAYSYFEINN